jgi:hypothetical protein
MRTLLQMLNETEEPVLDTIATTWGLKERQDDRGALAELLEATMLDAENAEAAWDALPDDQRQALQTVLGSGGKMMMSMFKHMFGDIRKMGRGAVEREQPHKSPKTAAEALYYKGFIAETIRMSDNGSQAFAYVPEDFVLVLPTHRTGYDTSTDVEAEPDLLTALDTRGIDETRTADTSIVDDMTALLAFLQLHGPPVDGDNLAEGSLRALMPYLLTYGTERVAFMVTVGVDAGLIEIREGRAFPNRANTRSWLEKRRSEQLELLIRAWLDSELYRELPHVGGLRVEEIGGYDPRLARRTLQAALKGNAPASEWWDLDEFIYVIKQTLPDFQRPNGDYDSWYITDITGEYVRGFESWDTVEGAQLEFIITGPLHWLGLIDVAPEAARLNAYGRGVVGLSAFPKPADDPEPVVVRDDGTLVLSRKVSRLDRFQVARFTSWTEAPPLGSDAAFEYRLDRAGVAQADSQEITVDHIRSFLGRVLEDRPLPDRIEQVLTNWRGGGDVSSVTLSEIVLLQTTSSQVLDELADTPEIRRYFGRRLGERAITVRRDGVGELQAALEEMGIAVEILA